MGEQPPSRGPSSAPMLRKTEGYTSVMEPQFNSGLLKSCMEHCAQICFEARKDGPGMKGGPSFPPTEVKRGHSDRSCLARMESHSLQESQYKDQIGRGRGPGIPYTNTPTHQILPTPTLCSHTHSTLAPKRFEKNNFTPLPRSKCIPRPPRSRNKQNKTNPGSMIMSQLTLFSRGLGECTGLARD